MNIKILGPLFSVICLALSVTNSMAVSPKTVAFNVLPRVAEYVAIAKANEKFLNFQTHPSVDPKKCARIQMFYMIADVCRMMDSLFSGIASFHALALQGGIKFAYENAYQYDAFWGIFDLMCFCFHQNKYNDFQFTTTDGQKLDEEKQDESAQIKEKKSKLVRALCIYVLPAIEFSCAAWSCSTFGSFDRNGKPSNTAVKDSALRAKLKAIQSMARLVSEMLMCKRGNKIIWIYAGLLVVVAAKLCWDWGMEGRAAHEFETRTPEKWAELAEQWRRNYKECKQHNAVRCKSNSDDRDDAAFVRDRIREIEDCQDKVYVLQSYLRNEEGRRTPEYANKIRELRGRYRRSDDSANIQCEIELWESYIADNAIFRNCLDEAGKCKPQYDREIRESRAREDALNKGFYSIGVAINEHKNPFMQPLITLSLRIFGASSVEEAKKKYNTLATRYHPDKGGDAEIFKFVTDVHKFLKSETSYSVLRSERPAPPAGGLTAPSTPGTGVD